MINNLLSLDNLKRNEVSEKISNTFKYLSDKVKELPPNDGVKENKILEVAEKILNRQWREGLKILTPSQMLSRLLISLPQLNAGNNSEKL